MGTTPSSDRSFRRAFHRAVLVFMGMAVGAALVLLTIIVMREPAPEVVYRAKTQTTLVTEAPQPLVAMSDAKIEAMPTSSGEPVGGEIKPYNPFRGKIGDDMPVAEISGSVPARSYEMSEEQPIRRALRRHHRQAKDAEDDAVVRRGLLVVSHMSGDARSTLEGLASQFGGSVIPFTDEARSDGDAGALLLVPAGKADQVAKALSLDAASHWSGSNAERASRIVRDAEETLTRLKEQREQLLIKYVEDAPQVVTIDEEMEKINRSLSAFRSQGAGANTAVFWIKFG